LAATCMTGQSESLPIRMPTRGDAMEIPGLKWGTTV
jgi:hypothetical protein